MRRRRMLVGCVATAVVLLGGCSSGEASYAPGKEPTEGPAYEAAMERCALSRLRNGGEEDPTTESRAYLDAYTACTYGRSWDDIGGEGRGYGPADPGYWTADE
ncbi:hypothetical protein ACWD7T_28135 [Streptomyces sp. 900116325]